MQEVLLMIEQMQEKAVKAGKKIIYAVLLLYYTLQKDNVPKKAKAIIIGALAYFIAPIDAIPDFLPIIGYTDDLGALLMALATVYMYIDNVVKSKARTKLESWFGQVDDRDIAEINNRL